MSPAQAAQLKSDPKATQKFIKKESEFDLSEDEVAYGARSDRRLEQSDRVDSAARLRLLMDYFGSKKSDHPLAFATEVRGKDQILAALEKLAPHIRAGHEQFHKNEPLPGQERIVPEDDADDQGEVHGGLISIISDEGHRWPSLAGFFGSLGGIWITGSLWLSPTITFHGASWQVWATGASAIYFSADAVHRKSAGTGLTEKYVRPLLNKWNALWNSVQIGSDENAENVVDAEIVDEDHDSISHPSVDHSLRIKAGYQYFFRTEEIKKALTGQSSMRPGQMIHLGANNLTDSYAAENSDREFPGHFDLVFINDAEPRILLFHWPE